MNGVAPAAVARRRMPACTEARSVRSISRPWPLPAGAGCSKGSRSSSGRGSRRRSPEGEVLVTAARVGLLEPVDVVVVLHGGGRVRQPTLVGLRHFLPQEPSDRSSARMWCSTSSRKRLRPDASSTSRTRTSGPCARSKGRRASRAAAASPPLSSASIRSMDSDSPPCTTWRALSPSTRNVDRSSRCRDTTRSNACCSRGTSSTPRTRNALHRL